MGSKSITSSKSISSSNSTTTNSSSSSRRRAPLLVCGLACILAVLYYRVAPDPAQGVKFFYVNRSSGDLIYLNISSASKTKTPENDSSTTTSTSSGPSPPLWSPSLEDTDAVPLPSSPDAPLAVIIHGYTENAGVPWIRKLAAAYHDRHPGSTVLVVDYYHLTTVSRPAMNGNIRHTAGAVAALLGALAQRRNLRLDRVHVLCYSLGCRVAGGVRERLPDGGMIGRITGLDPPLPWPSTPPPPSLGDYLDDSDASVVVLLRASVVGAASAPLKRDFTFNGGMVQQGCYAWYLPQFVLNICSHYRAPEYASEALLQPSAFPACPCHSARDSRPCHGCREPVHFMDEHVPVGRYHISTSSSPPYSLPLPTS